jgi:hypothetical protein
METSAIPPTEPLVNEGARGTGPGPVPDAAGAPSTPAVQRPLAGPALHSGPPDYTQYAYGYPPCSGRMFGSGN